MNETTVPSPYGLRYFLRVFLVWRWLVVAIAIVSVVVATTYSLLVEPRYRATAVLAPRDAHERGGAMGGLLGQIGGLGALAELGLGKGKNSNESIAFLQSRAFTQSFIEKHGLLPVLFASEWDTANSRWKSGSEEDSPTIEDAWRKFDRSVRRVSQDKRTQLITFEIEWVDRQLAANWANDMVAEANEALRERALAQADKSVQFLERELEKHPSVELRQSIFGLMEAHIEDKMVANTTPEFAFSVIDPAQPPDAKRISYPRRVPLLAGAGIAGLLLGMFLAVVAQENWPRRLH